MLGVLRQYANELAGHASLNTNGFVDYMEQVTKESVLILLHIEWALAWSNMLR